MNLRLPTGVAAADVEPRPLGTAQRAIDDFTAAGGVVDYALVAVGDTVEDRLAHRAAAAICIQQADARAWAWLRARRSAGHGRDVPPPRDLDPDRAAVRRVATPEQFVGPYYDWKRRGLTPAWIGNASGSYRISPDDSDFVTHGYADAFSTPPYSIGVSLSDCNAWFRTINDGLFGGLSSDLQVLEWTTDWAEYFEPGLEWWGAFCWTVRRPGAATITAICAASTD